MPSTSKQSNTVSQPLHGVAELQAQVAALSERVEAQAKEIEGLKSTAKTSMGSGASRASRKPKDPNAPKKEPNDWVKFTGRVRDALRAAGKSAGVQAQQYASHLKTSFPEEAYGMDADAIMSFYDDWEAPPAKPREKKAKPEAAEPAAAPEAKPKPKRSPEHLAAMAAGRRAAAERRKAEAAAKAAEEAPKAAGAAEPPATAEAASPKAAEPPKAPTSTLVRFPYKAKQYLKDPETQGMWERNKDGSKGKWAGILRDVEEDGKTKKVLDASAEEPKE